MDERAETLLNLGLGASQTLRDLVAALSLSDVIVMVTVRAKHGFETSGTVFVTATATARILRVEIDGRKSDDEAVATLGHELQHAQEIAGAVRVRSASAVEQMYRRVGSQPTPRSFETQAAIDAGGRVAAEVKGARRRTAQP